jgi:hypothetical protein
MYSEDHLFRKAVTSLMERGKELNCLYSVDELLHDSEQEPEEMFEKLVRLLPPGWQYSTVCEARILYRGLTFKTPEFKETSWMEFADIIVDYQVVGKIEVVYTQFIRLHGYSQFLPEEQRLLSAIADRVGNFLFHSKIKRTLEYIQLRKDPGELEESLDENNKDEYWKWRMHIVNLIAENLDARRFGVEKMYVAGSTKNANAGPASDIDLIIHSRGTAQQECQLKAWLEGWSLCLAEMNYVRTGYRVNAMIDLHIITDEDIRNKSSYAVMLATAGNSASEIPLGKNR